jgi:hypothetical protein
VTEGRTTEDTGYFAKHGSDPFGAFRHLDVEQFLDSEGIAQLVRHYQLFVRNVIN